MKKLYQLICFTYCAFAAIAQPGNLDPSFGQNGIKKIKYIPRGSLVSEKGESFSIILPKIGPRA